MSQWSCYISRWKHDGREKPPGKTKRSVRVQRTSSNAAVVTFKRQLVKNETSNKRKKKRRCFLPYWKLSSSKYDWTLFEIHHHCPPLFFFCFPCLICRVRKLLTLACCHPAVTALIQTIVWSAQMEPCPHFFFFPLRRQQRHGVTHTHFTVTIDQRTRETFLTIDATYPQELWTFITSATQRSLSSVQRTNRSVQLCGLLAASCHRHRRCRPLAVPRVWKTTV